MTDFEIIGEIRDIETIATGRGVYIKRYLERMYGKGRWRKMKGIATDQNLMVIFIQRLCLFPLSCQK